MKTQTTEGQIYLCSYNCGRSFKTHMGREVHELRIHKGRKWNNKGLVKPNGKYPSDSPAYRKKKYEKQKARFRKQGLTAQGKPFRSPPPPPVAESTLDAMEAILIAARVIQSVAIGMRIK